MSLYCSSHDDIYLNILKETVGDNLTHIVGDKIKVLLSSECVVSLIENKRTDDENLKLVCRVLEDVRSLLELVEKFGGESHDMLEEIFQLVREVVDNSSGIINVHVLEEVLNILCKICFKNCYSNIISCAVRFYSYQIHLLQSSDDINLIKSRLSLIFTLLNALKTSVIETRKSFLDYYSDLKSFCDEDKIISKYLLSSHDDVAGLVLLQILPAYVIVFENTTTLYYVWYETINGVLNCDSNILSTRFFTVLCYIYDLFVFHATDIASVVENLLQNENYWKVVQKGLRHSSHIIRKQALYLVKRSIMEIDNSGLIVKSLIEISSGTLRERLSNNDVSLQNGMKNVTISCTKAFQFSDKDDWIMWWVPDFREDLNRMFNDIFLVYETAEEKQSHLVKPVCNTMDRLIAATSSQLPNGKRLHVSWVLLLIERLLNHDNISVVRYGFKEILLLERDFYLNEDFMNAIIHLIVESFGNNKLLVNNVRVIREQLKDYFTFISSIPGARKFFQKLIEEISCKLWSPESLFIFLESLVHIKVKSWETNQLFHVKKILVSVIATHYKRFRTATQCSIATLIVQLTDVELVTLETLSDVFNCFREQEALCRGSRTWQIVVEWLEYCYSRRNAEQFIVANLPLTTDTIKEEKVTRMICLLYDAHLFGVMKCCGEAPSANVISIFNVVLTSFKNFDKRKYAAHDGLTHNLLIVRGILKETLICKNVERSHLVEIMLPWFSAIINFVMVMAKNMLTVADYETSKSLIDIIKLIVVAQRLYKITPETHVNTLFEQSLKILQEPDNKQSSPIEKCLAMQFLRIIIENVYSEKSVPKLRSLRTLIKNEMNKGLLKPDSELIFDSKSVWGKINSDFLEAQWWVVHRLQSENLFSVAPVKIEVFFESYDLACLCDEALQLSGSAVLIPVMATLAVVLAELDDRIFEKLVRSCWKEVSECRRNEIFNRAVSCFVAMLFQAEVVHRKSCQPLLHEMAIMLLTECTNGLGSAFLSHIQKLHISYNPDIFWAPILAESLVCGSLPLHETKLTLEVNAIIVDTSCNFTDHSLNEWNTGREIRARALALIMTFTFNKQTVLADKIVENLLLKYKTATENKSRYFPGSFLHLIKTRIVQALLVLKPVVSTNTRKCLYDWVCLNLLAESQQPSVRYLMEWLMIRLLWREPGMLDSLWIHLPDAVEQRVGSVCSFISVIYHILVLFEHSSHFEQWTNRAIEQFLPYCLAQHFSLRLYAQVALEKIWLLAEKNKLVELLQKFEVVRNCLSHCVGTGNALRNADKLRNDFYWTTFHPLNHFSILTIYRDLPRLAQLPESEWITPDILSQIGAPNNSELINLSSGEELWNHPVASWQIKSEDESHYIPSEIHQKKMIPVKSLVPDYEQLLDSDQLITRKARPPSDGLIVVASLIDRATNLGGLSRTCEAFGVSELVIASLKTLEDKQFLSLSVTSEKWVPITEIKPHHIADYLLSLKRDGYTVVGAEQTSKSKLLHQVSFPKRSVLLLGNEKEGLPPRLLPLIDICVEIPQLGVIRSLNVHVTGALFIWEYAKQHCLTGNDAPLE